MNQKKVLIYGYGNPGRNDDAIGPKLADRVETWALQQKYSHIYTDSNYQLNIEDAYTIKDFDVVIFIDASMESLKDYCFTRIEPSSKVEFTMHAVSPSFIADLCHKLFEKFPDIYLLHVKGYSFEPKEEVSAQASQNMDGAFTFLKNILSTSESLTDNITRKKC